MNELRIIMDLDRCECELQLKLQLSCLVEAHKHLMVLWFYEQKEWYSVTVTAAIILKNISLLSLQLSIIIHSELQ